MEVVNKKYAACFGKQKYFNTHENEINLQLELQGKSVPKMLSLN